MSRTKREEQGGVLETLDRRLLMLLDAGRPESFFAGFRLAWKLGAELNIQP